MNITYCLGRYIAMMRNHNAPGGFVGSGSTRVIAMQNCLLAAGMVTKKIHVNCLCS